MKKTPQQVFFIAEAGKNFIDHDITLAKSTAYYLENAFRLANGAIGAGADAIKFQTHVFEDEQHFRGEHRHNWIKFNEEITPIEFWDNLKNYCDSIGIEFMTTPMSKMAGEKVNHLVKRWKVGSGNVTDYELLKYLASTQKPIILSTGMSTQAEVEKAITTILEINPSCDVSLLYCKSIYPTNGEAKLQSINVMKEAFRLKVGYSDHSLNITGPMLGVMWGADIVEKHFTLDKEAIGPDHKISLNPMELKWAVKLVRDYQGRSSLDSVIHPLEEEVKLRMKFNK